MKSWMKHLMVVVLVVGLIGGLTSHALAVFGNSQGEGGRFVNEQGNPVPRVSVKITQRTPDGTTKTTETETDDRGFFFLPFGGGDVTQIQFTKNGETSTFSGPFNDLRNVSGLDPRNSGVLLEFNAGDSDEAGGIPNIANLGLFGIPNIGNGPGDEVPPWRVQNPGGPTFSTGLGAGFIRKDHELDFIRTNTSYEDRNSSGVPTGSSPSGSSNDNEDALTNDFDPNIALNIGFGEIFMTMPSQRFSKYRLDNALNFRVGAADVDFEQNTSGGSNNDQTEFTGSAPYIGFGGNHVLSAPGFPLFMGLNWALAWIPKTDLDREPVGSGTSAGAGTVLTRQNRISYQSSSVEARVGWIVCHCFAPFVGVGGSWESVDLRTRLRTDQGGGFIREERVDREYESGGAYGLAGVDFRVLRSPVFGRVQSTFNGDGYGMLFKMTMPFALEAS